MSLSGRLRQMTTAHPDADERELAELFIGECDRDELVIIVAHAVANIRRQEARTIELTEYRPPPPGLALRHMTDETGAEPGTWSANLRAVRTPLVGEGRRVRLGLLTAEQHDRRADFLEALAEGSMQTARMHRVAADRLRQSGVTCLDDLARVTTIAARAHELRPVLDETP